MDESIVLLLALLRALREHKGTKGCRESGVGAIRAAIGAPNIIPMGEMQSDGRRKASGRLVEFCRECAKCRLGRR